MFTIQSNEIIAQFNEKGAELTSLQHLDTQLEYIWQADPAFWGKHSPVLFPFVGGLKNNTYRYKGAEYSMSRHGFARDRVFQVEQQTQDQITFLLKSDEASRKVYPFEFEFRVRYKIFESTLMVTYDIINIDSKETLYASVGAHPAFKLPLVEGLQFEDYSLSFDEDENAPIYPLTDAGLVIDQPQPFLNGNNLPLKKELFYKDALVFKNLESTQISITSGKSLHGIDFWFDNFPYFGIWSAKDADFVCLEPWCGIADHENHSQELVDKEGINAILPQQSFTRNWSVTLF